MDVGPTTWQGIGRRFRLLERTEDLVRLQDPVDSSRVVEAKRRRVFLTITTRVGRICRSLTSGQPERWATLDITDLTLGIEADYSDLSSLSGEYAAEDRIFGLDDENLWEMGIDSASVVDHDTQEWLTVPFKLGPCESAHTDDVSSVHADNTHGAPVAELYHHYYDADGFSSSVLLLNVGLPAKQFGELIEACSGGRADTLVLECACYAYTTGWTFGSARDLILSAGETLRLSIEEATLSGLVPSTVTRIDESSSRSRPRMREQEASLSEVVNAPRGSDRVGAGLMIATVLVSFLLGLFGINPLAVLTIAILGGFAGLIAALTSIRSSLAVREASADPGNERVHTSNAG